MESDAAPAAPARTHWLLGIILATGLLGSAALILTALQIGHSHADAPQRELVVDSPVKSMGVVAIGQRAQLAFTVKNVTDRSITVVGAIACCGAEVVTDLPTTIPAGEARELTVSFAPIKGANETVRLVTEVYFDGSRRGQKLELAFDVTVLPASTLPGL